MCGPRIRSNEALQRPSRNEIPDDPRSGLRTAPGQPPDRRPHNRDDPQIVPKAWMSTGTLASGVFSCGEAGSGGRALVGPVPAQAARELRITSPLELSVGEPDGSEWVESDELGLVQGDVQPLSSAGRRDRNFRMRMGTDSKQPSSRRPNGLANRNDYGNADCVRYTRRGGSPPATSPSQS